VPNRDIASFDLNTGQNRVRRKASSRRSRVWAKFQHGGVPIDKDLAAFAEHLKGTRSITSGLNGNLRRKSIHQACLRVQEGREITGPVRDREDLGIEIGDPGEAVD
jgi:hypothetical protein